MKPINEVTKLVEMDNQRNRVLAIHLMLHQQFDILEKLMENNAEFVDSPMSYNACAGFLEQARNHAVAAFNGGVTTAPTYPDGVKAASFGTLK